MTHDAGQSISRHTDPVRFPLPLNPSSLTHIGNGNVRFQGLTPSTDPIDESLKTGSGLNSVEAPEILS